MSPADDESGVPVESLVERLTEMREEKKHLEDEIEKVSARLVELIGEGESRTLGEWIVRVAPSRVSLRVKSEKEVPEEFLVSKPDRKRLLEHLQRSGESVPGVELGRTRAIVYVKAARVEDV